MESQAQTGTTLSSGRVLQVALVSMPFVSVFHPSIQIGLLKAIAERHGFPTKGYHFNIDFAKLIGIRLFEALCEVRERRDGEWLFSKAAFGPDCPDPDHRYTEVFHNELAQLMASVGKNVESLVAIRDQVIPAFLDYLVEIVDWSHVDVVGFSSTFQQNIASFALARRLKQHYPHITTLFGGSNFESEMGLELVRSIDAIDYAILGEADEAFPEFLRALAEQRDPREVAGVAARNERGAVDHTSRAPFTRLDDSPTPDYGDYFDQALAHGIIRADARQDVALPFESSRGCWWGQKQHCVFCGLNGHMMSFRAKRAEKVIAELSELSRRHAAFHFVAVDNILPVPYFEALFDRLAREGTDFQFFYEVKSNLSREKLRRMRRGGMELIQPGIESLSSHVLSLMRKGVSAIQNVNTLRWCRYYGIRVVWNFLWGFPGETPEDYLQQATLMQHLFHLQPPTGFGPIWMERFSPIFSDPNIFPLAYRRPETSYGFIYPRNVRLEYVAYFFEYQFQQHVAEESYRPAIEVLQRWQATWKGQERPTCRFRYAPGLVVIDDTRDQRSQAILEGLAAQLYAACSDEPRTPVQLISALNLREPVERVRRQLHDFVDRGIAMEENGRFLSLALPWTKGR